MFTKSAYFYDRLYAVQGKDYAAEAHRLHELVSQRKLSEGSRLLDVGCGTGLHVRGLQRWYRVEGLDLDAGMLAIARQRCPDVTFHQADMAEFALGDRFDVVVCLFGTVGYAKTADNLYRAVGCMARHLCAGGVLVLEPWLTPETYQAGTVHAQFVDDPDFKVARMNVSERDGTLSVLQFEYLVGTPSGVSHFTERHELGLFSDQEYQAALCRAHLHAHYDQAGLTGRGLYVGLKPLA
jgi:ubiquinone/menaquinone biosynthesis C-methylase UbiE